MCDRDLTCLSIVERINQRKGKPNLWAFDLENISHLMSDQKNKKAWSSQVRVVGYLHLISDSRSKSKGVDNLEAIQLWKYILEILLENEVRKYI